MPAITKVLIANRGEIAVRVARALCDAHIASVAVYADEDRGALHVRVADEAYALHGTGPRDTYLDQAKLLEVARRSGADAVHPGYGFLSESAQFARAVTDAGLVWIGPPPSAIEALGDKVRARHIALEVGAPLVEGTADPVDGPNDAVAFAHEHGLPIAIKAAFGGGGRGLKVAYSLDEIPELFDSAVREATVAFGRGECFVERYLERPRHIETQCLADQHGTVVVVSTRDCSLQRRHQKLIEEAPAPFLTSQQHETVVRASADILRRAGYVGAGTCEFLLATDGTLAFLEVNTRLQVEHPVTEEVTGIDLVREQLRIAQGEPLGYTTTQVRGHAFEFRINGEDPAAGFMPTPGTLTALRTPGGPGVRLDTGYEAGDTLPATFDSLVAKLIVWGTDRPTALARAHRALRELKLTGIASTVPFHRAIVREADFASGEAERFRVHTRWIETDFAATLAGLEPAPPAVPAATQPEASKVVVEVGGKRLEVVLPASLSLARPGGLPPAAPARRAGRTASGTAAPSGNAVACPMQGTVVRIAAHDGDTVNPGDLIVVVEAMKMEQPITAHRAGVVGGLSAQIGQSLQAGAQVCTID